MVKKLGPLSLPVPEDDTGGTSPVETDDTGDDAAPVAGPLSVTSDPRQYNATMQNLLGQLVDTPEQQQQNEILAWGGGLTDPSGQADIGASIGNANRAQLAYRLKDKELRAQYIPMIMQALSAGQKTAGTDLSNINFRGMPEEEVARLSVAVKRDLLPYWKQANIGEKVEGGTYTMMRDPKTGQMVKQWNLDPKSGLSVDSSGKVSVAPGAAESQADIAGATTEATERAKAGWKKVVVYGPDNTPYEMFQKDDRPDLFSKDPKGTGAATLPPGTKIVPMGGPAGPGGTPPGPGGTGGTAQGDGGPRTLTDAVAYVESTGDDSKVNPKSGAKGAMQVIDSTNGKPGFGVAPAKDNSIEERNRVGRDLLAAWQKNYGDNGGLVAYNWGPGNYEKWKAAGSKWSDLPKETQEYIGKVNLAKEGHNIYGGKPSPQVAVPSAAVQPTSASGIPAVARQSGASPVVAQRQQEVGMQNEQVIKKDMPDYRTKAEAAGIQRDQVEQQRRAVADGAASGWGADVISGAAKIGAALGWEDAEKIATSSGAFNKAATNQVFTNLSVQNGVQTEGDAERMRESLARLSDTPQLTAFLLASMDASAKRIQMRSAFYDAWAERIRSGDTNKTYADINSMWTKQVPKLFDMPEMAAYKDMGKKK